MKKFLILIITIHFIHAQNKWNDTVANLSIKGIHEWEKTISETTLNNKTDLSWNNSFVLHFKIRTVETIELRFIEKNKADTVLKNLLTYNSKGNLITEESVYFDKEYCWITTYQYDAAGYFIGTETTYCAIVDFNGQGELMPNVIKLIRSSGLLLRKELSMSEKSKPYQIHYYSYNKRNLLTSIKIEENGKEIKTIIYNYTFY